MLFIPTLAGVALGVLPCSLATSPDDWPSWRGPNRDGTWNEREVTAELPDQIPLRWSVPIGPGYSSPTVAPGLVYVMDRPEDAEVGRGRACAWESGERLWTHEYACKYKRLGYDVGPRCVVEVADGIAYSLGAMGHLFALDARTGEELWACVGGGHLHRQLAAVGGG